MLAATSYVSSRLFLLRISSVSSNPLYALLSGQDKKTTLAKDSNATHWVWALQTESLSFGDRAFGTMRFSNRFLHQRHSTALGRASPRITSTSKTNLGMRLLMFSQALMMDNFGLQGRPSFEVLAHKVSNRTNLLQKGIGYSLFQQGALFSQMRANASSSSEDCTQEEGKTTIPLEFQSGSVMFPSVEKTNGGEDSFFISEEGCTTVGVADGVGGWSSMGVDAGTYSRQLMHFSKEAAKEESPEDPNPVRILVKAVRETSAKGSSTACIITFVENQLKAANLGDSGFIVVRGRKVVFKSPAQQHSFNFPFQVSSIKKYSDDPFAAESFSVDVMAGDTVVLATDGLFDNLYPEEIASMVYEAKDKGLAPSDLANLIAHQAHEVAVDRKRDTPFAYGARQAGYPHQYGGKMDDVTIVVTYAVQSSKL